MNNMGIKLLEYLPDPNTVKGGLGGIVDVVQAEAPLLVKELINYTIVYNLGWWLASILMFAFFFAIMSRWTWKWAMDEADDSDGWSLFIGIFIPIISCIACCFTFGFHFGWIKPLIAPRLFLLEYISNLL